MPTIRPSSDLRNNYNEISQLCHKYAEPIYITKNGTGDLAVMSIEVYEQLIGKFELYSAVEMGFADILHGKAKPLDEVFAAVEEMLGND